MRRTRGDIRAILPYLGKTLCVFGVLLLIPLLFVRFQDEKAHWLFYLGPAGLALGVGIGLWRGVREDGSALLPRQAMLLCTLSWLAVSAVGALPIWLGTPLWYLDSYFETMSGLTTTGITMLAATEGTVIDVLPRSVLFWRALIQWVGGLGILAMFLAVSPGTGVAHQLYGAESHKVASKRPRPGFFGTLVLLWLIYILITAITAVLLFVWRMSPFDALTHALTTLSTGGYSTHDASIAYFENFEHGVLIQWTIIVGMAAGGISFLVHYRVLRGEFRAWWDSMEIRWFWGILVAAVALVMVDRAIAGKAGDFGETLRHAVFQVVSLLTTTGFSTRDIIVDYGPVAKQVFLVLMIVGGCVGSTGGGFKVFRIAVLAKMVSRQLFRVGYPRRMVNVLYVDGQPLPEEEIRRAAGLFFAWLALLLLGGLATAIVSKEHGALASFSGMTSALGNIGPCFISNAGLAALQPAIKVVYILGMLAGRLEILPVLLLFTRRTWR